MIVIDHDELRALCYSWSDERGNAGICMVMVGDDK